MTETMQSYFDIDEFGKILQSILNNEKMSMSQRTSIARRVTILWMGAL